MPHLLQDVILGIQHLRREHADLIDKDHLVLLTDTVVDGFVMAPDSTHVTVTLGDPHAKRGVDGRSTNSWREEGCVERRKDGESLGFCAAAKKGGGNPQLPVYMCVYDRKRKSKEREKETKEKEAWKQMCPTHITRTSHT